MSFLMPDLPDTVIEGPRLDELRVSDSAYGLDIPAGFGGVRIGGNIIWSSGVTEIENRDVQEYGKGGGGGSTTQITYKYYCSFAIAFSSRQITNIVRVWGNNNLIIDLANPTSLGDEYDFIWRLYRGTEDQLPDPLIIADQGAATPAYRGLSYIVFENMPLEKFGNSIPSISAEMYFETFEDSYPEAITSTIADEPFTQSNNGNLMDWARGIFYIKESSSLLKAYNYGTAEFIKNVTIKDNETAVDQYTGRVISKIRDANLGVCVTSTETSSGTEIYTTVDGVSVDALLSLTISSGISNTVYGMVYTRVSGELALTIFNQSGVVQYDETRVKATHTYVNFASMYNGSGKGVTGFMSATEINLYSIEVYFIGSAVVKMPAILPGTVDSAATSFVFANANDHVRTIMDQESSDVYLFFEMDTGKYALRYDIFNQTILWVTKVSFIPYLGNSDRHYCSGTYVCWKQHNNYNVIKLDCKTGDIVPPFDGSLNIFPTDIKYSPNWAFYNDKTDSCLFFFGSDDTFEYIEIGSVVGDVTIDKIIEYVTEECGLNKIEHLNAINLTNSIGGYVSDKIMKGVDTIEPLVKFYNFDSVERDGYITYIKRGASPALTITEDDFTSRSKGRTRNYTESRIQEAELPQQISLKFKDRDNSYLDNNVTVDRVISPNKTVLSDNKIKFTLPAVTTPNTAKQQAEKLLYSEWIERVRFNLKLAQKYLYLDPTDVIQFDFDNGESIDCRIDVGDIGKDLTTKVKIMQQRDNQYVSSSTADGGQYYTQILQSFSQSRLYLIDSTLARDEDDTGGNTHNTYFGSNAINSGLSWGGANVYRSYDDELWDRVAQTSTGMEYGYANTVLGNPSSYWRTDNVNTLDVVMTYGGDNLASVTNLQMLNKSNAAFLIKANGEVAIIQYQNVTSLGSNTYRLDTLLRGRRGTDTMDKDYLGNEIFIPITVSNLRKFNVILDDRNDPLYYRPVTFNKLLEESVIQEFTHTGRDLKPYSPVNLTAVNDGSNNIDFSWQRRTRIGGETDLGDGGDGTVPLNEQSEAYEMDIYFSGSIIRTVTGITTTSYEYTAADQTTDGFTPGSVSTIQVDVYQVSAIVGRGFVGAFNIEVT